MVVLYLSAMLKKSVWHLVTVVPDPHVQVPEVDTAVRSLTVMWDGSLVVAANNNGTCYVWRLVRGTQVDCSLTDYYHESAQGLLCSESDPKI